MCEGSFIVMNPQIIVTRLRSSLSAQRVNSVSIFELIVLILQSAALLYCFGSLSPMLLPEAAVFSKKKTVYCRLPADQLSDRHS